MLKYLLIITSLSLSAPSWAAKLTDPNCQELDQIGDKFTPEYLAVIDGYNKAGKKIASEVDIAGIVDQSDKVKMECGKNKTAKLSTVEKGVGDQEVPQMDKSLAKKKSNIMNPARAKCQDFVAWGARYQPVATFWVAGHAKSGKLKTGEVDEEYLEQPVATLIEECRSSPKASFYNKARTWLQKHI